MIGHAASRRAPEGWRRTVGILLRVGIDAICAVGVRAPGPAGDPAGRRSSRRTARALLHVSRARSRTRISRSSGAGHVTLRRRFAFVDVVAPAVRAGRHARRTCSPGSRPAARRTRALTSQARVHQAVVEAYNHTRRLPEIERPGGCSSEVRARRGPPRMHAVRAPRLLSACCLSFEKRRPPIRRGDSRPPSLCDRDARSGSVICPGWPVQGADR